MFHVVSNIFSLIFNKVLIHTNCRIASVATRGVFNFLYKETANPNIFVIHMLRLLNTLYRRFFS
jgi:hypothetical protein